MDLRPTDAVRPELADLTPEQRELLALRLRNAAGGANGGQSAERSLPLSFTQEQLWFLDRLEPGTPVYNVPFAIELTGPLDIEAVEQAVDAIVARHEALRSVFREDDRGLRQTVRSKVRITIPRVDLRAVPREDREQAAQRLTAAHAGCSFDLSTGPLLALQLLTLDDEEHLLLVSAHHIVFDAWSAGVFMDELCAFYEQFAQGRPAALPALSVQFGDHVTRSRNDASAAALDAHLAHWRQRLADAPAVSTLPPDQPRPPLQTHRGGRRAFVFSPRLTNQLSELARSAGVTVNALVLTGLAAVLRRATGQEDVVLGMPAAGRSRTELEPLIGCFANMLVLRTDLTGDPTVRELVGRTHKTVSDAYAHQDAPYARVVEEVSPPRDASVNPLFQVMLTIAEDRDEPRTAAGVRFTPKSVDNGLTDFDIFITLTRRGDELEGSVDYNADLYLEETIDQTVALLPAVLADMVDHPDHPVQSIESLRRQTVAVAATFTADLLRAPLDLWLRFLRIPATVAPVPYGQMIPQLVAGDDAHAATLCLLRWEDWLRHWDSDRAPADELLDAAMRDLEVAAQAYRQRSGAPLLLVVCPASPRFQESPWRELFARLDDRLALLRARLPDVDVVWAVDEQSRYAVSSTFDARADELGNVPYTAEYSAALATIAARELWRASSQSERIVIVDERLPWREQLIRAIAHHRVVAAPAGALADRVDELVSAGEAAPEACVVLDPDVAAVEAVREAQPQALALVVPDEWAEASRLLGHVWPLDPAGSDSVDALTMLGPGRAAYLAEHLTSPAAVIERLESGARRSAGEDVVVAPRTATEERLASLWREVLRLDEVGVTGDFFALGGHSLLATQLLSRVHAELGVELSLYTLFTHPTIEELAGVLDESGDAPTTEPVLPAPLGFEPMASSTQERLWALAQIDDEVARHNTNFAAVLRGGLDEDALRGAAHEVVRRHEALRTTFGERRGRPLPIVHAELDCWCEPVELSSLPDRERDAAVRRQIDEHRSHSYDLAHGPLLRVQLLRVRHDEHYLLIGMHHIICDNQSWSIFLEELVATYNAAIDGTTSSLPAPALQFTDFAFHQRDWLDSDAVEPELAHWREKFSDVPSLELPTDHPRPDVRSDVAGHHAGSLAAGLGAATRELARAEGVTPFVVLMSAFALLLRRESAQSDLVLGVPTAGRERPELERVIGCFTDLLPFRLDLTGRPSFRQLLRRVHATALDAYRHQSLPFAKIVEALRLPRDPSRHPLFGCVFNVLDLPDEAPSFSGLDVMPVDLGAAGVDFDLFLTLSWRGDDLHADLAYAADLFTPERATRLLAGLSEVLAGALAQPDAALDAPRRAQRRRPAGALDLSPQQSVAIAGSFPADDVVATLRFWSQTLQPSLAIAAAPTGQVLRPLLDPRGGFGADPDALNAVLLRWQDWLPDRGATQPHALGPAVKRLERALLELCEAIESFRRRSDAPLLIGLAPASPTFSAPPWHGITATATERLRRFCNRYANVEVLSLAPSLERYAVTDAYDAGGLSAELGAVAGTLIARRAYRRWHPAVSALLVDPARTPAPVALAQLAREQVRCGRAVVLTSPPASPELEALVAAGVVRLVPGEMVQQLGRLAAAGTVDAASCVVLSPDAATTAAVKAAHPETIVVEAGSAHDDELRRSLARLWILDSAPADASVAGAAAVPADLLVEIAAELRDGDAIRSAVEDGYRGTADRSAGTPRNERERALAAIWADLLRVKQVGVHDDFFELGGDSLLAMQIVFRAAEGGIELTPRQLARHPTVAELCALDATDLDQPPSCTAVTEDADRSVPDELPVTPAQQWFLETLAPSMAHPAHFNHPYYLELRRPVAIEQLEQAIAALATHHDALRLRFQRTDDGEWRQRHAPMPEAVPFASHDLSSVVEGEHEPAAEKLASAAQTSLDLTDGPTARVLHLRFGPGQPDRLLIVAHHLVVDAISRGILLEDLQTLYEQLERGEQPRLPAKTTPYGAWALRLADAATSHETRAELPFWLDQVDAGAPPRSAPDADTANTLATLQTTKALLSADETARLHAAGRSLRVGIRDLLVWAAVRALADAQDSDECTIATTGHGREDLFEDVDSSRTVGWFQVLYPIRLRLSDRSSDGSSLIEVRRQLERVPRNGIGYALLRFAGDRDTAQRLRSVAPPRIAVNYMGTFGFEDVAQGEDLFSVCDAPYGATEDGECVWPFELDVTGSIVGGALRIELSYGTASYRRDHAETLLDDLRACLLRLIDDHAAEADERDAA